jgi:hypothetical protein
MLQRGQGPYGSDEQRAFVPLSSLLIRLATISTLTLTITIAAVLPGGAQVPAKKTVASAADLPRFTYPLAIAPSVLIQSDAPVFDAFAAKVLTDIDGVLAGYDIEDHATLRGLLEEQLELQLLSGTEDAAALSTADQMRALVDKPDAKLLSGLSVRATVAARTQTHATAGDAYLAAFGAHFSAALAPLPWPVVGSALKELKTTYELLTPALLVGQVAGTIDPAAAQSHSVSGETAATIIRMRYYVNIFLPQRVPAVAALSALIAQHTVQKPDIWTAREVTLGAADKLTPVRIAVWDSGSDVTLFPKQLYTDLAPAAADPHGLAFDLLGFKTHGDLYPLTPEQRASYPAAVKFLAGYSDLQESIDSPAAAEMKQQVAALAPAAVTPYFQNLNLMSIYSHGTHVAGIALRGNPAARLVVARVTFDYRSIPLPLTEELARREAGNYQKYVDYFRAHHVRVVNMSWGGTRPASRTGSRKTISARTPANARRWRRTSSPSSARACTPRSRARRKFCSFARPETATATTASNKSFRPRSSCRTCSSRAPSIKPATRPRSRATARPCSLTPTAIRWRATSPAARAYGSPARRWPHRTWPTWPGN